jgi:ketosteroid isomerase-like protein
MFPFRPGSPPEGLFKSSNCWIIQRMLDPFISIQKGVSVMSEIENKAIVRRIFEEMWNTGDLDAAEKLFAEPVGVARFVGEFLGAFPDLQHTVEELLVDGERVVARFTARGTHSGPWKEFPASGRRIEYTGVTLATVRAGKITQHQTWWDRAELLEQIR